MSTSFAVLGVIAISLITQISKQFILPKYGENGVHAFVFLLALIATGIQVAMTHFPGFAQLLIEAGSFLVTTIGAYEVLFKKISL
jgi:hypothetical protein